MQFTDITVLLDRSASMAAIKASMNSALDEFVLGHRAVPTTRLTLVQFDDVDPQEVVYEALPIGVVPASNLQPRGNTPLLDALCQAIDATVKRLEAMTAAARPDQVLFVIITDGEENASRQYNRLQVRERITHQHDAYQWQFVYLGANQDVFKEAAALGIDRVHTMSYAHTGAGASAGLRGMSVNTVSYAQNVNRGSSRSLAFNDDQRAAASKQAGTPIPAGTTDDDDE
jgi:hypothetical protein